MRRRPVTVLAGLVAARLGARLVYRAIDRRLRPGRAERQLAVIERKLARSADRMLVVLWLTNRSLVRSVRMTNGTATTDERLLHRAVFRFLDGLVEEMRGEGDPYEEQARTIVGQWASQVGPSALRGDDAARVDRYHARLVAARRGDCGAYPERGIVARFTRGA